MDLAALPVAPPLASDGRTQPSLKPRDPGAETVAQSQLPAIPPAAPPLPAPIKGLGIAPLETSVVGDNDDVPDPADNPPDGSTPDAKSPIEDDHAHSVQPPAPRQDLPELLRDLDEVPSEPLVDLRR